MKKIILAVLLVFTFVLTGCDDEELIEIDSKSEETNVIQTELVDKDLNSTDKLCKPTTEDYNVAESPMDSQPLVVFVNGSVNNPGVYELSEGSRVIDAIDAAGGYSSDACDMYINLARILNDEEMLYIPSNEEIESATEEGNTDLISGLGYLTDLDGELNVNNQPGANSSKNNKININKASKEELMTLPGIGESKAEKIIAYREENGPFSSPEGIMEISGIKDGMYNKIKDSICTK